MELQDQQKGSQHFFQLSMYNYVNNMYIRPMKTTFSKLQVHCISKTTNQSWYSFSCTVIGLVLPLRLAKSHDFVVRLMISRPISHSRKLATDFSHFLVKLNSKKILEPSGLFPSYGRYRYINKQEAQFQRPSTGKLGTSHDFLPNCHYQSFPGSRFRISYFLPFLGWQVSPLLLATPTIWFSLNKFILNRQTIMLLSSYSDSDSIASEHQL